MDYRDAAAARSKWYVAFDQKRMIATVEWEHPINVFIDEVPCEYIVCSACEGKGSYVNPSIDAHGISPDEFYDDPDFAEDYFAGRYDIPCACCDGRRVVPWPIEKEHQDIVDDWLMHEAQYARECYMERMMGA